MDDIVLRTSEEIVAYAYDYALPEEFDIGQLLEAEKAHRYIMDYARTHDAYLTRLYAAQYAHWYKDINKERSETYQWYADHIHPE